jgi:hypothetical protein
LREFKITFTPEQQLQVMNIIGKYQGFRTSKPVRELFILLVNWQHKKLNNRDPWLCENEDNLLKLSRALGGYQHPIREAISSRFSELIERHEEGDRERLFLS